MSWGVVRISVMEHCDHKDLEHCDERGHGALLFNCDDNSLKHYDDGHGAL